MTQKSLNHWAFCFWSFSTHFWSFEKAGVRTENRHFSCMTLSLQLVSAFFANHESLSFYASGNLASETRFLRKVFYVDFFKWIAKKSKDPLSSCWHKKDLHTYECKLSLFTFQCVSSREQECTKIRTSENFGTDAKASPLGNGSYVRKKARINPKLTAWASIYNQTDVLGCCSNPKVHLTRFDLTSCDHPNVSHNHTHHEGHQQLEYKTTVNKKKTFFCHGSSRNETKFCISCEPTKRIFDVSMNAMFLQQPLLLHAFVG